MSTCAIPPREVEMTSLQRRKRWQSPPGYALLLPVLFLAAFLRTQDLESFGLQAEESIVQRTVEFSWSEMFDRIGRDTHPPLFYVLDRLWVHIVGDGIAAGRALSVLLGLSAVIGIYALVREATRGSDSSPEQTLLNSELPALLAAIMLTLTPLQIFWSMQIRMNALAIALTAWSTYLLLRAWRSGGRTNWSLYTLFAVLLTHTHYFGLFTVASQFLCSTVILLGRSTGSRFERLRPLALSAAGLWFAWQPWLPYFLQQRAQVNHGFYLPKPSWTVFGDILHQVWISVTASPSPVIGMAIGQVLVIVLLLLLTQRTPAALLLTVSSVLPMAAAFTVSSMSSSILHSRYFLQSQVFWIAAVSLVVCRFWIPCRLLGLGLLVGGMCWSCSNFRHRHEELASLPGMKSAMAKLDSARGREPLVVCNPMLYICAVSYSSDRQNLFVFQPRHGLPFYHCTAVLKDEQRLEETAIAQIDSPFLWTMDADESLGRVPVPGGWKLLREERVPEWYIGLILRLYARE